MPRESNWTLRFVALLGVGAVAATIWTACGNPPDSPSETAEVAKPEPKTEAQSEWNMKDKIVKTEEEWKTHLTEEQFRILRKEGTERAFTGAHWDNKEEGVYRCAGCALELFSSETKFDSGTGWPSFYQAVKEGYIEEREDRKLFMTRTEVRCARCEGHLGHVFDDGPKPTGLRYCINSAALQFEKKE